MLVKRLLLTIVLSTILILNACQSADEAAIAEATFTPEASATSTSIPPTATAIPTSTSTPTPAPTPTPQVVNRLHGLNLGPYLYDDPNYGVEISTADLSELIERIAPYTYWIRTYSVQNGLENAGMIAHANGLQIAAGAWLGTDLAANEKEMESLIQMAQNGEVDLAVIGNETLLRGDLTSRELLIYINRFKQAVPDVPATTADSWEELQQYPDLIAAVDVVGVNMYPYWAGLAVDESASTLEDWYLEALSTVNQLSPGKEIIITESGWPSCGNNGSSAQQSFYLGSFTTFATALDVQYFWFEAYDEQWKSAYEGEAGACWGLLDEYGNLKENIARVFAEDVEQYIIREPRLEIISHPAIGSSGPVTGIASNVDPSAYYVVVYIYVPDASGWWVKPTFDYPINLIGDDGSWSCPIVTGGIDAQATKIAVFLLPVDYEPPLASGWSSLPQELYDTAVSSVEIIRN